MTRFEQLTDLSEKMAEQVISDYEAIGAKVRRQRQRDGNWTVTAKLSERVLEKYANTAPS